MQDPSPVTLSCNLPYSVPPACIIGRQCSLSGGKATGLLACSQTGVEEVIYRGLVHTRMHVVPLIVTQHPNDGICM